MVNLLLGLDFVRDFVKLFPEPRTPCGLRNQLSLNKIGECEREKREFN
jgi:hypothetical protein